MFSFSPPEMFLRPTTPVVQSPAPPFINSVSSNPRQFVVSRPECTSCVSSCAFSFSSPASSPSLACYSRVIQPSSSLKQLGRETGRRFSSVPSCSFSTQRLCNLVVHSSQLVEPSSSLNPLGQEIGRGVSSVPSCSFSTQLLCNPVAHCSIYSSQLVHPYSFKPLGRETGRKFFKLERKFNFEQEQEQQHSNRGLGGGGRASLRAVTKKRGLLRGRGFGGGGGSSLRAVTRKRGLSRVWAGEGLRLGGVECSAPLKEGDPLMKAQETSSGGSDSGLPHAEASSSSGMGGKSGWGKLAQSVNLSGVLFSARVMVKDRHLAVPHVNVPDISWVDWKALRNRGFEGVVFDKDNTLTAPYGQDIWPPLKDALAECREVFNGRIALLSNSAGLYQYDPSGSEAKALENKLGVPVIRHDQKKPAGNALAESNYFGCDPSMLIMVGDRYFTDVLYGNSNGLLTIRTAPLTKQGEPFTVKRVRKLEETLVDWWRRHGVLPPKHKLFENPVDFIKDPGCW